jgi:drug/metabolite transporter superfamily protein YnfA
MRVEVHNRCSDFTSYRAARVKSLFNADSGCNFDLVADLPIDDADWGVGLIVGPSGSGKTSLGRQLFGEEAFYRTDGWPADRPIVDAIAPAGDFDAVTAALASVGLGTVPAWLLLPAAVSLALFAWLLSLHPTAAGRVYAAYGGVYVAVALVWLWQVDGVRPTVWDLVGAAVALTGMAIIMLGPRHA